MARKRKDEFSCSSEMSAADALGESSSYDSGYSSGSYDDSQNYSSDNSGQTEERQNYNVSHGEHNIGDWIQFFICLVFGGFGIHKFLEGKIFLGIIYLCTNGLFYVGWILDAIKYFRKASKLF